MVARRGLPRLQAATVVLGLWSMRSPTTVDARPEVSVCIGTVGLRPFRRLDPCIPRDHGVLVRGFPVPLIRRRDRHRRHGTSSASHQACPRPVRRSINLLIWKSRQPEGRGFPLQDACALRASPYGDPLRGQVPLINSTNFQFLTCGTWVK